MADEWRDLGGDHKCSYGKRCIIDYHSGEVDEIFRMCINVGCRNLIKPTAEKIACNYCLDKYPPKDMNFIGKNLINKKEFDIYCCNNCYGESEDE